MKEVLLLSNKTELQANSFIAEIYIEDDSAS